MAIKIIHHHSAYYRLHHFFAGIHKTIKQSMYVVLSPALMVAKFVRMRTERFSLRVAIPIAVALLCSPFLLIAVPIGALLGVFRGVLHALTRTPLPTEKIDQSLKMLARYKKSPRNLEVVSTRVMLAYQAQKSMCRSRASERAIESLNRHRLFESELDYHIIKRYLTKVDCHNGRRLFAIFCDVLCSVVTPEQVAMRNNVRMLVLGQRDRGSLFSTVPKDVLKLIAAQTVSPVVVDEQATVKDETDAAWVNDGVEAMAVSTFRSYWG